MLPTSDPLFWHYIFGRFLLFRFVSHLLSVLPTAGALERLTQSKSYSWGEKEYIFLEVTDLTTRIFFFFQNQLDTSVIFLSVFITWIVEQSSQCPYSLVSLWFLCLCVWSQLICLTGLLCVSVGVSSELEYPFKYDSNHVLLDIDARLALKGSSFHLEWCYEGLTFRVNLVFTSSLSAHLCKHTLLYCSLFCVENQKQRLLSQYI